MLPEPPARRLFLWVTEGFPDGLELVARTAVTVMAGHVLQAYSDGGTLLHRGKLRLAAKTTAPLGGDLGEAG